MKSTRVSFPFLVSGLDDPLDDAVRVLFEDPLGGVPPDCHPHLPSVYEEPKEMGL